MESIVGKLVGKLGQGVWAQVYDYSPDTRVKNKLRGRLVAVVSLQAEEAKDQVEMVQIGRELLSRLHEQYYGNETDSAFTALRKAVNVVRSDFVSAEICGVAMVEGILYVVNTPGTGVWVKIAEKEGWLVKPNSEVTVPTEFSGRAMAGELIVLGNHKFWDEIPEGTLKAAMLTANEDMTAGIEILTTTQRGVEGTGGEAGAVIKIQIPETIDQSQEEEEAVVIETENVQPPEGVKQEEVFTEQKTGGGVGKLIHSIKSKVGESLAGKIYIRHGDKQDQRKKLMYLGLVFLVILLLMGAVGQVFIKERNIKNSALEAQIEQLASAFDEANAVASLNPARSRQLLTDVKAGLLTFKETKNQDDRIKKIVANWDTVWQEAHGITKANIADFLDLNLVRSGMTGTKLALGDSKLEILDSIGGRVVEADLKSGSGTVVAGGDSWKGARLIATYPGKTYVVASSGMMVVGGNKAVIDKDNDWGNITDVKVYAGNIYILDQTAGQIWRFNVNTNDTFSKKQSWLTEKSGDDEIKQGAGMAIDGSIWIIKPGGLIKYTRGVKETVTISGLESGWGGRAILYTNENAQKLYVLDPDNKRVIIMSKTGQYEQQLVSDALSGVADFVVDEKNGKMYFVGNSRVFVTNYESN